MRFIRIPLVERILLLAKTVWDWSVAQVIVLFLKVAKKLPAEKSTNLAERFGRRFAFYLPRAKMARKNMALAFPEKSEAELDTMVRDMWGNVARTIAEYVLLDQLFDFDINNPDAGRVEVRGVQNFIDIYLSGRPTIVFTGHTGNWEILPVAASSYSLEVTALFRPPNNRFLAQHVLKARHTDNGSLVPSRAGAAWALADVLEAKGTVGLLADQAFTKGPHIDFLGRRATANPIAAKLARQFDADIYPARCVRLPGGRFRLELHDRMNPVRDKKGDIDIVGTTERINGIIESWVREHPEQWLWLHKRWKIKEPERAKWRRGRA